MGAAISLQGVGKRYWKMDQQAMLMKSVLPFARPSREEMWALRHLDLEVAEGETVGVIGRNGAGKTTLLRLLAGVSRPTEGSIRIHGRIAPLISVGVGFHAEMSGRENVLVNGMLLGLTARQVAERFDSIVEFAELAEFIDTPVKFYSSGMLMRLGFAVLVHIDPQVLLIDEVLAVGDGGFQTKCFDEMRRLQEQGTSIVLVSHSLLAVRHLCSRAVVIRKGRIDFDGEVEEGLARHVALMAGEGADGDGDADRAVLVLERELLTGGGDDPRADYGQPVELRLRLRFLTQVRDPQIVLTVSSEAGMLVCLHATSQIPGHRTFEPGEESDVRIRLNAALGGGVYQLGVEVRASGADVPPLRTDGVLLYVSPRPGALGLADVQAAFEVDGAPCPP